MIKKQKKVAEKTNISTKKTAKKVIDVTTHTDTELLKNKQNTNQYCKGCELIDKCDIGRLAFVGSCIHREQQLNSTTIDKVASKGGKKTRTTDNIKKEKPAKTSSNPSAMNDRDYVSSLTESDVVGFSRYELFKCNKKRKAIGLEPLRRAK